MAVSVVSFSFTRCSTGGQEAHSAGWWLSLLHLISNFSGPQLNRGHRAPSVWRGFPYHISSVTPPPALTATRTQLSWLLSWLSYITVQRPLDRPLDLWNRMFNHYQAEITVMQFRGHSLPMRQSMRVSWFPLITAIRMCHFLSVHHLGMAFLAGSKAKIQHMQKHSQRNNYERNTVH